MDCIRFFISPHHKINFCYGQKEWKKEKDIVILIKNTSYHLGSLTNISLRKVFGKETQQTKRRRLLVVGGHIFSLQSPLR